MAFQSKTHAISWCEKRPARRALDESWILAFLDSRPADFILEVGPGNGARGAWLLRRFPYADYVGYEPSPKLAAEASSELGVFAERAAVERRNLALQLPLGNETQNVVLCLDLLEYLRMDELYMLLAEARRVTERGGICFLRALSPVAGRMGTTALSLHSFVHRNWPKLVGGRRPLELNHYISPEDWRVLLDRRELSGWFSRQTVVLERL
jgi:SAM-dependent methyltransferase